MSDTNGTIGELIRAAEAGVKCSQRHWWSLGMLVDEHYSLPEQLEAIAKLGDSGSKAALTYLEHISQEALDCRFAVVLEASPFPIAPTIPYLGPSTQPAAQFIGASRCYPNAKGQLGRALLNPHSEARQILEEARTKLRASVTQY